MLLKCSICIAEETAMTLVGALHISNKILLDSLL